MKDNFYSLRVPRPIIASLYLFTFLYLLISMEKGKIFSKNKFIWTGVIFGFSLSSFFYFFVIEIIAFSFFLFYKFKFNFFKKILENYKYFLLLTIFFIISIFFKFVIFSKLACGPKIADTSCKTFLKMFLFLTHNFILQIMYCIFLMKTFFFATGIWTEIVSLKIVIHILYFPKIYLNVSQ